MLLQADSRGRIVLPKSMRKFGLFEVEIGDEERGIMKLFAVEAHRLDGERQRKGQPSSLAKAHQMLVTKILPQVCQYLETQLRENLKAVILYGSMARDDYRNQSDVDLALILERPLKLQERLGLEERIDNIVAADLEVLRSSGFHFSLSFTHLPFKIQETQVYPLLYSIADEGKLISEHLPSWQDWKLQIKKIMKLNNVHREKGSWKWEKN